MVSGGEFPLDGEPIEKITGTGLSEHWKTPWQPAGGAVGTSKKSQMAATPLVR